MKSKFLPILASILIGTTALAQDNRFLTFQEAKQMADQGDAYGEAIVAFHYSMGWQTEKNLELAAKYATSSARKGNPMGIFRLGVLRCAGEGIEPNKDQGLALQKKAFAGLNKMQGNPYAITALGEMLAEGKVVPENKKEAARLFKVLADSSFAPAQFNYAMCAQAGHGVATDEKVAAEYKWKSLLDEYPLALSHLGLQTDAGDTLEQRLDMPMKQAPSESANEFEVTAIVQRSPSEDAIASTVSAARDRLAVVSSSIGIWELPSGRLLSEFPAPEGRISCAFFRGDDFVVGTENNAGAGALIFLSPITGKPSRSDISIPERTRPVAYCPIKDAVLCVSTNQTESYGRAMNDGSFQSSGGEPDGLHLVFVESQVQRKLPYPPFLDGCMMQEAMFDVAGNIMLLNIYPEPPYYGVSEICIIDERGNILKRLSRGSNDFMSDAAKSLGIPKSLLSSSGDSGDTFGFGDIFGAELSEEGASDNNTALSFIKSMWQWKCMQPQVVLKLRRPAKVWTVDASGMQITTPLAGSNFIRNQYIASDNNGRGFLTWGVHGFSNDDYDNVPYVLNLDTLVRIPIDLPPDTTLVNARSSAEGFWDCALGEIDRMNGEHRLALTFATINSTGFNIAPDRVGYSYPYEITDATMFNEHQAVLDARPLVEKQSTKTSVDKTFHGSIAPRRDSHGELNLSAYSNSWDGKYKSKGWTEGRLLSGGALFAVWNSAGERDDVAQKPSRAKFFFNNNKSPTIWQTSENASEALLGVYSSSDAVMLATTHSMYLMDGNGRSIVNAWKVPERDRYPDIDANYVRPLEKADYNKAGFAYFVGYTGSVHVLKTEKGGRINPIVRIDHNTDGLPILFEPGGTYLSLAPSFGGIHFSDGRKTYPLEQFDLRLNRPDIVLERLGAPDEAIAIAKQLREKRLKRMGVTEDMLQPDFHLPEIEIVGDLPSSTMESELALKINASDSKYPLDRLRVYVNNVPVNGKEGELLRAAKSQTLERTIPIKLAAGRNKIQVSVLNSAGTESLYANAEVTCTAQRPKPTLYAVAMGVSEYANPEWNLKYAAKDARDILDRVKARSGSSYGEIKELLITDSEATKESLGKIRDFLSTATVDDTVLLFVAGHGLLDSKYDYYFGTADIDFNNPSGNGIAFEEFDDLLAELPCLRKSLLIDTCHAGELDEEEKKILASAGGLPAALPLGQGIAMRSVGKRGMTIKPIEGARGKSEWYDRLQGLFVDLRRGSGSTILSSSAGAEYALESSEQKNGLFTYAVLEALDGKEGSDANKDGSVTMSELANYVKTRVATLTNNKQTPNVRRVNLVADFALSRK